MRFLVDAQLPPTLSRWLGERGFAATPARELGLRDSDDGSIWNFATAGDWTVVTTRRGFRRPLRWKPCFSSHRLAAHRELHQPRAHRVA